MTIDLSRAESLAAGKAEDTAKAAKQLEAYFLRQVLAEVRKCKAENSLLDGGFSGSMFSEMLDEVMADAMAESGGFGIAKDIQAQMERAAGEQLLPQPTPLISASRGAAAYGRTLEGLTVRPVDGAETSSYGMRLDPVDGVERKMHTGVDLAGATGTPVRAAGGGVVTEARAAGGYGNMVVVDHGGGIETRYAHLSVIGVQKGDRVASGQVVGEVGATGHVTGPHLHFEVRRDGKPMDPTQKVPGLEDLK